MRILQVFNQYRYRGGEESWVDSIPLLLGHDATVRDLRFSSADLSLGHGSSAIGLARNIGDNPGARELLRNHVREFKPDVLLFHNVVPVGSFGLYFEAKKLGLPVLQYTHNFRPFSPSGALWSGSKVIDHALRGNLWPEILSGSWQGSSIKTAVLSWHLRRAIRHGLLDSIDHWLAISDFMRDRFIEAGISPDKITTIRHCAQSISEPAKQIERDYYLFLGRLVPEKGVLTLLDAWRLLEEKLGKNCPRLLIAGNGPLEATVRRHAADVRSIQYMGYVEGETKAELIQECRAMLVPSIWWEPLGLTTYEGYSACKPVIAASSGALKSTVIDLETGWQHRAGDPADLARCIIDAEKVGLEKRAEMGVNGHRWLCQNADSDQWKADFLKLVQTVVQQTSPGT